jgi:DNA replication protein DnaC
MDRSTDTLAQRADQIALAITPTMMKMGRRQENCSRHGVYMPNGVRLKHRDVWDRCPACIEADEAVRRAAKEREAAERARVEFEEKLQMAAIPPRFIGKTLDNFRADTDGKRNAATVARDFIEDFPLHLKRGDGLILSGMPGTGKSHLAAAILQGILPQYVGMYATCMGAIRAVRETWRKDSERSEREVLTLLGEVPLLVLDEIGVQYGTDGEQTIIFDILDRRYRDMMPSILLTNQDKAGLKTFIGERAYDRLTETCRWVPFDWPSYRTQARKEAA